MNIYILMEKPQDKKGHKTTYACPHIQSTELHSTNRKLRSTSTCRIESTHPSSLPSQWKNRSRATGDNSGGTTVLSTEPASVRRVRQCGGAVLNLVCVDCGRMKTKSFFFRKSFKSVNIWQRYMQNTWVVSCTLCAWPTHCEKTKKVHETTTFVLVTLANIHWF